MTSAIVKDGEVYDFSIHKMPVFKVEKRYDWIVWGYCSNDQDYSANATQWNNLQPLYYDWLYNSSSKHRAIVNRKCLFIKGKGLKGEYKLLDPQEKAELGAFVFNINNSELIKKWSLNLTKIGGFAYEVIPDKGKKKIEPHFLNFKNLRRSKPEFNEDGTEKPVLYYFTKDWEAKKPETNPDFKTFHEWDFEKFDSDKRYIVIYQEDDENPYPIPEYTAAVPYIAADYEVGNFTYNVTKNGFVGSYLINFYNGDMEEDQKREVYESVKAKLHGTDNTGEPVVSFQDIDSKGVEITPINPNGQDDRFINLNKQIREEIFAGHTVDPVICGLEGSNGFNNNADEKRTAIEDFQSYYVTGKQQIIEDHLNAIRAFNQIKGEVFIQRLDPIQEQITEAELAQILTIDERRERAGYEPQTDEQKTTIVKETIKETERQFKEQEDDIILEFFAANGMWDEQEGFEVIRNKEFFAEDIEDAQRQEFATALEALILRLLGASPNMPLDTIAKAANASVPEVETAIGVLREDGLLNEENEVTTEGEKAPDEIFIVYKYEKSNRASGSSIIPGTRPFCRTLVNLSKFKSWTLEDIKRMNNGQGLDVFRSRGGFWNDSGTIRPSCRHVWKQILVRRKNG